MKHLTRSILLDAPFSSVIEYVSAFFDAHPDLRLKSFASTSAAVETRSELVEDRADMVRRHDALAISWKPRWFVFPSFDGSLSVRPQAPGSILAIEGTYQPPGGWAGHLFDRVVGERLAVRTLEHLLRRLRDDIRARHRLFQQSCPTVQELNASANSASGDPP
ncbi:MAG: hypothetical protein M3R30_01525 [Candidatus Eremiobacteraeota bacterium]|nr:hypothetical protein [Candidatus Eremiobacteraeota bacterium]